MTSPEDEWQAKLETERRRVEDAINTAISNLRGGMVTKWWIIFEFIDKDGERDLASMSTADLMEWDVTGMIEHIAQNTIARRVVRVLREEKE